MTLFFRQARSHLAAGGRMLILSGTSRDTGYLMQLMAQEGISRAQTACLRGERDGVPVENVIFKAT